MSPIILIATSVILFVIAFAFVCDLYRRAKELAPVMRKLQEVEAELIAKTKECDVLKANLEDLRSSKIEALRIIDDGVSTKKWLEAHEPRMRELKAEEERLMVEVERAGRDFITKNSQLDEVNQKLLELGKVVESAQEKRIVEEQKLLQVQSECSRFDSQKRSLEADINSIKKQIGEIQAQLAILLRQKDELVAEIADLNRKKAERDALLHDIERLKREYKEAQENKLSVASAVDDLTTQKMRLTNDIARMQGQLPSEKTYWQELDLPLDVLKTERSAFKKSLSENEWLKGFKSLLEDSKHGFQFDIRTIKSFHTGLKCGEVTPLVVLAGISGTGKSLLPELYAAYAGMNFLSVPVQPRWDSPQDMLGFCNYMEGRYKATELARLLWQVQDVKSESPLNIVLLDEMNLARVEYYFSDLLSKLEMRRGLENVTDKTLREKAAITLEGFQQGPRHLYVNTNVFFVGTMNEDETTQMLSDKVVDRSNLIRFGQPRSLGVKPNKGQFLASVRNKERLTNTIWKGWRRTASSANLNEWFNKIQEINNWFATIERPFAHRVDQAIRDYMTQYPYENNEYKIAFADQLEMKILPKINGVELAMPGFNHVKNNLIDLMKTLEDQALLDTFQKATDESYNTFFKWRGVMR